MRAQAERELGRGLGGVADVGLEGLDEALAGLVEDDRVGLDEDGGAGRDVPLDGLLGERPGVGLLEEQAQFQAEVERRAR